eukprot:3735355-Pyramimonas_sp.AAC.1
MVVLSAGRSFRNLAQVLARDGLICFMPDLAGFGRSPWPDVEEYNVNLHLAYLLDMVDAAVEAIAADVTAVAATPADVTGWDGSSEE